MVNPMDPRTGRKIVDDLHTRMHTEADQHRRLQVAALGVQRERGLTLTRWARLRGQLRGRRRSAVEA
jgi:hypothetical protein